MRHGQSAVPVLSQNTAWFAGHHDHVDAHEAAEAHHYAKYAVAVYGADGYSWIVKRWTSSFILSGAWQLESHPCRARLVIRLCLKRHML